MLFFPKLKLYLFVYHNFYHYTGGTSFKILKDGMHHHLFSQDKRSCQLCNYTEKRKWQIDRWNSNTFIWFSSPLVSQHFENVLSMSPYQLTANLTIFLVLASGNDLVKYVQGSQGRVETGEARKLQC